MTFPKITTIDELLALDEGIAFDLDETCSWTVYHWVEEMQELFGNPEQLTTLEMVEKYQYVQNVPYYDTPEVNDWIEKMLTSNELQVELPLIPGVKDHIESIGQIIPVRCYLTIRPDTIVDGTREWLEKHQFPEAAIFAKPVSIDKLDGNRWKANILQQSYPIIKGIVDDNQGLVKELPDDYLGKVFLFGHESFNGKNDFTIPCKDWSTVYQEIKRVYVKS
jgi:hypothetical protein